MVRALAYERLMKFTGLEKLNIHMSRTTYLNRLTLHVRRHESNRIHGHKKLKNTQMRSPHDTYCAHGVSQGKLSLSLNVCYWTDTVIAHAGKLSASLAEMVS